MEFSSAVVWVVVGLLLLGAEMFTGTFAMLLLAGAAFIVCILAWLHVVDTVTMQLIVFGFLSVASLILFKSKVKSAFLGKTGSAYKGDFGEAIVLTVGIPLGGSAEADYQGAKWTIVNLSNRALQAGESVKISRVEGVKLIVE